MHIIPQGSHRKLSVQPTLEEKIKKTQGSDQDLMKIRKHTGENKAPDFRVDDKETLWYKNRICVPKEGKFRNIIMDEAHNSAYSIQPGATKMYMDLRQKYWWNGMKAPIVIFAKGSKPSIRSRLGYCNHYPFRFGNGMRSAWILWLVYPGPRKEMTLYG